MEREGKKKIEKGKRKRRNGPSRPEWPASASFHTFTMKANVVRQGRGKKRKKGNGKKKVTKRGHGEAPRPIAIFHQNIRLGERMEEEGGIGRSIYFFRKRGENACPRSFPFSPFQLRRKEKFSGGKKGGRPTGNRTVSSSPSSRISLRLEFDGFRDCGRERTGGEKKREGDEGVSINAGSSFSPPGTVGLGRKRKFPAKKKRKKKKRDGDHITFLFLLHPIGDGREKSKGKSIQKKRGGRDRRAA